MAEFVSIAAAFRELDEEIDSLRWKAKDEQKLRWEAEDRAS